MKTTKNFAPTQKSVMAALPTVTKLEDAIEAGNAKVAKALYEQVKDKVTPKLRENLKSRVSKLSTKK